MRRGPQKPSERCLYWIYLEPPEDEEDVARSGECSRVMISLRSEGFEVDFARLDIEIDGRRLEPTCRLHPNTVEH
jgi:hypothetical protein